MDTQQMTQQIAEYFKTQPVLKVITVGSAIRRSFSSLVNFSFFSIAFTFIAIVVKILDPPAPFRGSFLGRSG